MSPDNISARIAELEAVLDDAIRSETSRPRHVQLVRIRIGLEELRRDVCSQ
jgi:hypothetical protein